MITPKEVQQANMLEKQISDLPTRGTIRTLCNSCHAIGIRLPYDRQCGACNSLDTTRLYEEDDILKIIYNEKAVESPVIKVSSDENRLAQKKRDDQLKELEATAMA